MSPETQNEGEAIFVEYKGDQRELAHYYAVEHNGDIRLEIALPYKDISPRVLSQTITDNICHTARIKGDFGRPPDGEFNWAIFNEYSERIFTIYLGGTQFENFYSQRDLVIEDQLYSLRMRRNQMKKFGSHNMKDLDPTDLQMRVHNRGYTIRFLKDAMLVSIDSEFEEDFVEEEVYHSLEMIKLLTKGSYVRPYDVIYPDKDIEPTQLLFKLYGTLYPSDTATPQASKIRLAKESFDSMFWENEPRKILDLLNNRS